MSREILFRGKTAKGEWVYGSFINSVVKGSPFGYIAGNNVVETVQVMRKTVGQFTVLTDKNGKKIFEGDIVRGKDYVGLRREGVVEYDVYDATYKIVPKTKSKYRESDTIEPLYPADILEVIGNIFDNPEFLQEK